MLKCYLKIYKHQNVKTTQKPERERWYRACCLEQNSSDTVVMRHMPFTKILHTNTHWHNRKLNKAQQTYRIGDVAVILKINRTYYKS